MNRRSDRSAQSENPRHPKARSSATDEQEANLDERQPQETSVETSGKDEIETVESKAKERRRGGADGDDSERPRNRNRGRGKGRGDRGEALRDKNWRSENKSSAAEHTADAVGNLKLE